MTLTTAQKIAYFLTRTPGIGVVKGRRLMENGDVTDVEDFLYSAKSLISAKDYEELVRTFESVDTDSFFDRVKKAGVTLIAFGEEDYPESLTPYGDMPVLLYCKGNTSLLKTPSIGVVGTRYPTHYGTRATQEFVKALSERFCIVSGLARGVDAIAHRTALENGARTIAVLGCGVDVVYPAENSDLFEDVCSNGLLLSEFALGTSADAGNFPTRNRIISGLSRAVLVTEAGLKSGTLHTVNYALKQGKTVYGVPGSIYSDRSAGVNALIRNGEIVAVTKPEDVLEDFGERDLFGEKRPAEPEKEKKKSSMSLSEEEQKVLDYLNDNGETHFEELLARTELPVFRLTAILVKLEALKKIMKTDSNFWSVY
ncbi:MAG: DNA-processing protein DprA [Clostridia bacterium]|nr:DNA-processing protein DprA [Clostridia bacterium]